MIVTIDEARVGHPSIKLDGMELAGMVKSYTLRHGVDEAPVLELELYPAPIWPRLRSFWTTRL